MNDMDKRLEAIKEIIVGNNFEKINGKIGKLAHNLEQTNSRLIDVVEQLSDELNLLRLELEKEQKRLSDKLFEESEDLRNRLHLQAEQQSAHEEKVAGQVESLREEDERLDEHLERIEGHNAYQDQSLSNHESALQSVEDRLEDLGGLIDAMRSEFSAKLRNLQEEQADIHATQTELFHSLSEEVDDRRDENAQVLKQVHEHHSEIKAYVQERGRAIAARQDRQEKRMEALDDRLVSIHDLIEDEVFKYFEDLKAHKKENRKRLQDMQQEIYNQLDETYLRLEGRIDGLMEANTREIKKLNKKMKNKESLKRTLGRLGDLLDD